jgi:hypothetical protein
MLWDSVGMCVVAVWRSDVYTLKLVFCKLSCTGYCNQTCYHSYCVCGSRLLNIRSGFV